MCRQMHEKKIVIVRHEIRVATSYEYKPNCFRKYGTDFRACFKSLDFSPRMRICANLSRKSSAFFAGRSCNPIVCNSGKQGWMATHPLSWRICANADGSIKPGAASPRLAAVKTTKPTTWATAYRLPPVSRAWERFAGRFPRFRLRLHPGLYAAARFMGWKRTFLMLTDFVV